MARSRISTGFHRIGVVLAVPLLICAGAFAFGQIIHPDGRRKERAELTASELRVVRNGYEARQMSAGRVPLPESNIFWDLDDDTEATMPRRADFLFAGICMGLGIIVYATSRALGWIIDGFRGASH